MVFHGFLLGKSALLIHLADPKKGDKRRQGLRCINRNFHAFIQRGGQADRGRPTASWCFDVFMSSGRVGYLLSTRTWLCAWKAAIKNVCLLARWQRQCAYFKCIGLASFGLAMNLSKHMRNTHTQCVQLVLYADAPYAQVKVFNYSPAAWQISWCVVAAGGQQTWWIAPTTTRKQPWKCHVAFEKCALMR